MSLFKLFIVCGLIVIGTLSVEAADMEIQMVDKNCWIEVFDDTKYDADDPHVKVDGPKEYASLKNLNGRDWNNDIQSVIVGSGATVLAYNGNLEIVTGLEVHPKLLADSRLSCTYGRNSFPNIFLHELT
ncbi:MAG TPA: hypothetical protein VGQ79_06970 [Nitrospiraceae bacterium]|jgi:hypothetical protein|nr:hypothetical protein [Nitrospiraceae bacterium]